MTVAIAGAGALAAGVSGPADLGGPVATDPDRADWFNPVPYLGKRGWKYLTPATRHLLAAANQALGRAHSDPLPATPHSERLGVSTGTNYAIAALHTSLAGALRAEGVTGLSPAEVPGFSVNIPASQLAITLAARAFSVTMTNPVTAGLEAVLFAASALRTGRADRVVASATEEAVPGRARGGAAALVLESGPAAGRAELVAGCSRFVAPQAGPNALADAAKRVVALSEMSESARPGLRYAFCGPPAAVAVDDAVRAALGGRGVTVGDDRGVGAGAEYGAASGLFRLIALLGQPGPALLVAAAPMGHIVAITVRGPERVSQEMSTEC